MEYFKRREVDSAQQEFEDSLFLACNIKSREMTAITPEGRQVVYVTFVNFKPAIVYINLNGEPIWASLKSFDPKIVTRGVPDAKSRFADNPSKLTYTPRGYIIRG